MKYETVLMVARTRGVRAGRNAASWVFDGNTKDETRAKVAQGIDDGDPAVNDMVQEPSWLSGEWAGESISELLGDLLEEVEEDEQGDVMDAYEQAAQETFWHEVERAAKA